MAEYIEREALVKRIEASPAFQNMGTDGLFLLGCVTDLIAAIPTADVVEVVRCKDCKNWGCADREDCCANCFADGLKTRYANDYCSRGERREG